jgi:ABC-type uncharacterized transport system substrate-binding protein
LCSAARNWNNANHIPAMRELSAAARRLGQEVMALNASAETDFEAAFATLTERRASALVVSDDALFTNRRATLATLAARHAVPAIYGRREFAASGGLMSYGASTLDQYYQSGVYVGRILKDAPTYTANLARCRKVVQYNWLAWCSKRIICPSSQHSWQMRPR